MKDWHSQEFGMPKSNFCEMVPKAHLSAFVLKSHSVSIKSGAGKPADTKGARTRGGKMTFTTKACDM